MRGGGAGKIVQGITAEYVSDVLMNSNCHIQEAQENPTGINRKRSTNRHIILKMLEVKDKGKTSKASKDKGPVTHKGAPVRATANLAAGQWRPGSGGTTQPKG